MGTRDWDETMGRGLKSDRLGKYWKQEREIMEAVKPQSCCGEQSDNLKNRAKSSPAGLEQRITALLNDSRTADGDDIDLVTEELTLKNTAVNDNDLHDKVQEYYGKVVQKKSDLQTSAASCCYAAGPDYIRPIVGMLHDEVVEKFYGCGFCVPHDLDGSSVLDLGCGAGRDCFILSQLVGENGEVVGVDMTESQLEVANKHVEWHADRFGFETSNVSFLHGYIEKLGELGLSDDSFDVVVSNCVINLSPDKEAVLREAFRVLRNGGEMFFSDVYAMRRIPEELRDDPVLFGECLSGAMYWNDFITLAKRIGFRDPRVVSSEPFKVTSKELKNKVDGIDFVSTTFRLFKLPHLDETGEDYGQAVQYKGTVFSCPRVFQLDRTCSFEQGCTVPVSRNTFRMLQESRFAEHFTFIGDEKNHYGPFPTDKVTL